MKGVTRINGEEEAGRYYLLPGSKSPMLLGIKLRMTDMEKFTILHICSTVKACILQAVQLCNEEYIYIMNNIYIYIFTILAAILLQPYNT